MNRPLICGPTPAGNGAERFGIEYYDIPMKLDCTSPIIRNLAIMRDYLQPPVKMHEKLDPGNLPQIYLRQRC